MRQAVASLLHAALVRLGADRVRGPEFINQLFNFFKYG